MGRSAGMRLGLATALIAVASFGLTACDGKIKRAGSAARNGTSPTAAGSAAMPAPTRSAGSPPSTAVIAHAVEQVGRGATPVFGLRDSSHLPMETLQVVPSQDGYLGVYHVRLAQRFAIRLATSTDLRSWLYQAQLDVHASMAALTRLSDGGYLLADEADNSGNTGRGQRWLRLRHYAELSNLLAANPDRTFNVPHTLAAVGRGAEGTPNIYAIRLVPDIDHSTIGIGFHYLSGGVDREARGTLTNFRSWTARPDNDLDTALSNLGMFGKHGDRDSANLRGSLVTLVECQDGVDRKWHVAMYDPTTHTARILQIKTPRGSTSFANPNIEYSSLPDGHTGIIVTLYLPLSGSAPGESGELLYYTDLPATPRAAG